MSAESVSLPEPLTLRKIVRGYFSSITILACLGTMFYLGHHFKWDIPRMAHALLALDLSHDDADDAVDTVAKHHHETVSIETPGTAHDPAKLRELVDMVQFKSPLSIAKAGIEEITVESGKIEQGVRANGIIDYDQTKIAQLSARVPGTVWRVERKVGEPVKKGDVLAIIESADVGNAKAEFLAAVALVDIKEKLLQIVEPLVGVVPVRQVKEAESALREARVRLFNAHQALVNLGLVINIDEARKLDEASLSKRMQFLGLPKGIAETLDPQMTTANLIPLLAPFNGVVLGRDVVLGEVVSPQRPQFVVADINTMWLKLDLRVEDASRVCIGQDVIYQPDGLGKTIRSKVSWISTAADEKTRTIEARCDVANPIIDPAAPNGEAQRLLHAHSFGAGQVIIASREKTLTVPKNAVQYDEGKPVVFVRSDDQSFTRRPVTLGVESNDRVEITGGVKAGEKVVTIGSHLLKAEAAKNRVIAGNKTA